MSDSPNHNDAKHALSHILWIGGSPAAGKSTIATMLARKYQLGSYNFDDHEQIHAARRIDDPASYPAYTAFRALTTEQRWLLRSVEEMAQQVIAMWTERFTLVVDDLLAMPTRSIILAEGPGLFPDSVLQVIASPRQAIWLVPTASFCRTMRLKRDAGFFADISDPERALHNLIKRDILLADYVQRRAIELGLTVIQVDGGRSVEEIAVAVERHLEIEKRLRQ